MWDILRATYLQIFCLSQTAIGKSWMKYSHYSKFVQNRISREEGAPEIEIRPVSSPVVTQKTLGCGNIQMIKFVLLSIPMTGCVIRELNTRAEFHRDFLCFLLKQWNVMPQIWLLVLGFVFVSLYGYFSIFLSPTLHYRARLRPQACNKG